MPHYPKPFYREPLARWYVQIAKKQIPLGHDPKPKRDKTGKPIPPKDVVERYHELMVNRDDDAQQVSPALVKNPPVAALLDEFLEWGQEDHRTEASDPRGYTGVAAGRRGHGGLGRRGDERPAGYRIEVVSRPPGSKGYVKLPRRWVVERTFAWLGRYRRNSRDDERSSGASEAMIKVSSIHRMLRLLKPDLSKKPAAFNYRELQENVTG